MDHHTKVDIHASWPSIHIPWVVAKVLSQHGIHIHQVRPSDWNRLILVSSLIIILYQSWILQSWYRTRMANSTLKCRIIILITARSFCSYNNILINFEQLYSNSCYTTFNITTLGICIACEFHQLWAVRPCIYQMFRHFTKWLIFCRIGHACTVISSNFRLATHIISFEQQIVLFV